MEKFYVTLIKEDSQIITMETDRDMAVAKYHHEMWYAHTQKIKTTCYVTDDRGTYIVKPDVYVPSDLNNG